ncbi:heavy metal translocating P-type ATPase [Acidisoma sp. C75]
MDTQTAPPSTSGLTAFAGRALVILLIGALALAAWRLADLGLLLFAAVLMATGLRGAAKALVRVAPIGEAGALGIVVLLLLAMLAGCFWLFGSVVAAQLDELARQIPLGLRAVTDRLGAQPLGRFALEQAQGIDLGNLSAWMAAALGRAARILVRDLAYGVLTFFVAIYLAAQPDLYRQLCLRMVPPGAGSRVSTLFDRIAHVLRRWLLGQLVVMATIGILSGVGLWALGIEAAAALGLVGGLLTFIPYVGAVLAAVPATLVALTQSPTDAALVILMYMGVHFVEGNFITPLVQAEATAMPPVLSLLSTIAFSILFGPAGALLAAPLTLLLLLSVEVFSNQPVVAAPAAGVRKSEPEPGRPARPPAPKRTIAAATLPRLVDLLLLAIAGAGLAAGLAARWAGWAAWAEWLLLGGTAPVLAAVLLDSLTSLARREVGLDIIALLSIGGALALGENLAAAVIALMLASGRALEDFAEARAKREMSALLARVPRSANRYANGTLATVPLESILPGDRLLVRVGETVPTDGTVLDRAAVLDESALTGEPIPVTRVAGTALRSGAVNLGAPFDMEARSRAAESTFAGIVRLVAAAQAEKAPSSRLADRAAFLFTPLAVGLAGAAWAWSGDPVRGLAVMVVATPCPLILGVPVAIVSGLSRCARRGVLVKGGGALEVLAQVRTLFLDKTGTLTAGHARILAVEAAPGADPDEVLRLGASLDQGSQHPIAQTIVAAAHARGLSLALPTEVEEEAGAGVSGLVEGRRVAIGSHAYALAHAPAEGWTDRLLRRMAYEGATGAFVLAEGRLLGAVLLADEIRPDAARALRMLRQAGVRRTIMLTGDRRDTAEAIGAALGVDDVRAEQGPGDKLSVIAASRKAGEICAMVGDGVNDAPALAAANVGIAMGARGSGASSEAADVVLLVDRLDRLAEALAIARGTRRIAVQTVGIGMGLSAVAMIAAALGLLPPVAGALLQEVIDTAAILNALRVLRLRVPGRPHATLALAEVARLQAEHERLAGPLARLRIVADQLATLPPAEAAASLIAVDKLVREQLLRHEREDDTQLYPPIERALGGNDPIAAMHRAHREVQQLGSLLARMTADLPAEGPGPEEASDFRRVLYGLDAILRLHFAQEDELYHSLAEAEAGEGSTRRSQVTNPRSATD